MRSETEAIPTTRYKTKPHPPNTVEVTNKIEEIKEVYRRTDVYGIIPPLFRSLQSLKRELTYYLNQQQSENKIIEETDIEKKPKIFWRNVQKLKGDLPTKKKITLKDRNGEEVQHPQQIERKFREVWKKVFQISEEEEELFDDQHENNIKERMIPLLNRIIPLEITEEGRFNEENSKITMEELVTTIKSTKQRALGITGITKSSTKNDPANFKYS